MAFPGRNGGVRRNAMKAHVQVAAGKCEMREKVAVEVSVHVTGEAANGTLVTQDLNTIEVEADVSRIPEHLEVSVEALEAGTQVLAGSIPLPAGTTLRTDPEALVVNVVPAPTAADLEGEIDIEGAGVVEDASQSAEGAESEGGAAAGSAADS